MQVYRKIYRLLFISHVMTLVWHYLRSKVPLETIKKNTKINRRDALQKKKPNTCLREMKGKKRFTHTTLYAMLKIVKKQKRQQQRMNIRRRRR